MPSLVAFLPDENRRRRLARACASLNVDAPRITWAGRWNSLRRSCRSAAPRLVMIDPYGEAERLEVKRCRRLVREFPLPPVVAYANFLERPSRDLLELGEAGFQEVVADKGGAEISELRALIERPPASTAVEDVLSLWETLCGRPASPMLHRAVRGARGRLTRDTLARAFHCSRWTLARRLAAEGLPPPNRLIVWGRLLIGAWLLEHSELSVEQVALRVGCGSPNQLRNQLRLYAGVRPKDLRAPGGVARAMSRLLAECTECTAACDSRSAA